MAFFRSISDSLWGYLDPRKTQKRRAKPFKAAKGSALPSSTKDETEDKLRAQVRDLQAQFEDANIKLDNITTKFDDVMQDKVTTTCVELRASVPALGPDESTPALAHPHQKPHIPVCVECYKNQRRCDVGDPCKQCRDRGERCVRSKCQYWKSGTCTRKVCNRWHEEDGAYENIEHAGRVLQGSGRKGRKPKRR